MSGHTATIAKGGDGVTVHKTWVVIYSSEELPRGEISRRLEGLEWWITDRENYQESRTATRVLDLTQLKD